MSFCWNAFIDKADVFIALLGNRGNSKFFTQNQRESFTICKQIRGVDSTVCTILRAVSVIWHTLIDMNE